jgi:hypothetical protein
MSATPQASTGEAHSPNILGDLMHSLCQPLTTLRCSLELSLDNDGKLLTELPADAVMERQQENISLALQQTDEVIRLIQLMRDYLDTDDPRTRKNVP